jgi:hypothetical protein
VPLNKPFKHFKKKNHPQIARKTFLKISPEALPSPPAILKTKRL